MQGQTYGLSFWVPLSAGVIGDPCREAGDSRQPNPYSMRSGYSPALVMTWFGNNEKMPTERFDYDAARRLMNEFLLWAVQGCFALSGLPIHAPAYPGRRFACPEAGTLVRRADRTAAGPRRRVRHGQRQRG